MNSSDQLLRLFKYDRWANEQILATLQDNMPFEGSEKCLEYFAHIAGSQEMWYGRIKGSSLDDIEIWPDYGLAVAQQKLNTLSANWKRLLDSNSSNLDKTISYNNSKGTPFDTALSDILHHMIIHGQHHRAQIAQLLRQTSIDPPTTDFIYFSRSN